MKYKFKSVLFAVLLIASSTMGSTSVASASATAAATPATAVGACKPPSLCVPVNPPAPPPPTFTMPIAGYCISLVGPASDIINESLVTSGQYSETAWANLINDCYSHAESVITGSQAIQNCTARNLSQDNSTNPCELQEYLVSGGVAYEIAFYQGSAPSLTGLIAASPAPTQAPAGGSLSGLCEVTFSYLGGPFGQTPEPGASYSFVTVSPASDSSLETSCAAQTYWFLENEMPFEHTSWSSPQETLTDLNSGAVVANGLFKPSGDTLTGLCSWNTTIGLTSTPAYDYPHVGVQTLWDNTDDGLIDQCSALADPQNLAEGYTVLDPLVYSVLDQTTGQKVYSVDCTTTGCTVCTVSGCTTY